MSARFANRVVTLSNAMPRRSRMRRSPTGKHIALTQRDIAIFRALAGYRFLRSTYLHAFAGGASQTRFKERLGDLYHEGFLERPEAQWRFADAHYLPAVHELADGGRRALAAAGIRADERTWLRGVHRQYEHALMTCEVLASLELGLPENARFIGFPEILARAPSGYESKEGPVAFAIGGQKLVPDALFGIGYRRGAGPESYRFFAVEIDRGTMPLRRAGSSQSAFLPKLAAYGAMLRQRLFKTQLGLPNLLVLTVTAREDRMHNMLAAMRQQPEDTGAFLFGHFRQPAAAPIAALAATPWLRASDDAVDLSRP